MLETRTMIENGDGMKGGSMFHQFLESLKGVLLRPGAFFQRLPEDSTLGRPAIFLLACSGVYSVIAALLSPENKGLLAGVYFANAFLTPWIMAVVLYLASMVLCRNRFTFQTVFGIAAYASVTLLVSWIPGVALFAGIWRFYLVGLGLVRAGHISVARALVLILVTAAILLLVIQWFQPFQRNQIS
jgi:hypothetical protein